MLSMTDDYGCTRRARESQRESQREPERARESQRESQREPERARERARVQLVIGLIICQAFLLLLMRLTPYRKDGHDVMAIFAYLSLTLTMLIGSLKSTHEYQGNSDTDQIGQRSWANLDNATLGSILICINRKGQLSDTARLSRILP